MTVHVCFCTPRLPYPPVSGGKIETHGLIKSLTSRGHEVRVIAYGNDTDKAAELEAATGCTVRLVPGLPDTTPVTLLRNLFASDPHAIMTSRTERFQDAVAAVLRRQPVDVLHLHTFQMSYLAESIDTEIPVVIRFTNVKSAIYEQFAQHTDNRLKAAYADRQARKTEQFECEIAGEADRTLAITDADARRLHRNRTASGEFRHRATFDILPAAVDLEQFSPGRGGIETRSDPDIADATADGGGSDRPIITFFGSMDYYPNEDAAIWFTNHILPRLREHEDVVFEVVSKDSPDSVQELASRDGVRVTGFVEDIGVYLERATAVVVPVRIGTGVHINLLHAMAMSKPIVTTPTGAQGIDAEDGVHLSVADEETTFAAAVRDLLADADRRVRYQRNARALVEEKHSLRTVGRSIEQHYEDLIND